MKGDWVGRATTGWLFGLLLGLVVSSAPALAQRKPKEQKTPPLVRVPDEQAIDTAISEMLGAWQIGDTEMLHKYYGEDVTVVSGFWEPPLVGWANYLRAYQSQRQRVQTPRLERRNTYLSARGDLAWAVYQWDFGAVVDGKPASAHGHTTLILQKRSDRWVIVHNHTSVVPELKAPESAVPPDAVKPAVPPATRPEA